jgi:multidrug efflux pump subunit AcrB
MAQPEVQRVYSRMGMGGTNQGSISVQLIKGVQTDPVIQRLRGLFPQYRGSLIFSKPNQFMGVGMGFGGTQIRGRPVQISIQGPSSLDTLDGVADEVIARLSTVPGLRDVAKSPGSLSGYYRYPGRMAGPPHRCHCTNAC